METSQEPIFLTQYSHGAGCGCKISPKVLDEILVHHGPKALFSNLLVGNEERDDAAVVDLGDGTGIISTTDFFMPIVDDPADFGRIAAVNAISDVYAMGGAPLVAIAILGWPIGKLSPAIANQVVAGGRLACEEAGIPLAGGHSIDAPEPIFGLAVTGRVSLKNLKKNGGAHLGDYLYLTKGLGVGILSTAQKKGKITPEHHQLAVQSMTRLNKIGTLLGGRQEVHALTDVTGFGLLGHLTEMCEASQLSAKIEFENVPLLDRLVLEHYLSEQCIPGGTLRNWESYGHKIGPLTEAQRNLLADPQTSGGLLVAVDAESKDAFESWMATQNHPVSPIGQLVEKQTHCVIIH